MDETVECLQQKNIISVRSNQNDNDSILYTSVLKISQLSDKYRKSRHAYMIWCQALVGDNILFSSVHHNHMNSMLLNRKSKPGSYKEREVSPTETTRSMQRGKKTRKTSHQRLRGLRRQSENITGNEVTKECSEGKIALLVIAIASLIAGGFTCALTTFLFTQRMCEQGTV